MHKVAAEIARKFVNDEGSGEGGRRAVKFSEKKIPGPWSGVNSSSATSGRKERGLHGVVRST